MPFKTLILLIFVVLAGSYPVSSEDVCRVSAVGDIMFHIPIQRIANRFGFYSILEGVKDDLEYGDIVFANLESPMYSKSRYSGYPLFNANPEYLDDIKKAGFNVLNLANNHALDRGASGLLSTISEVKKRGFLYLGVGRNAKDLDSDRILNCNGIKVGFLGFSYGTNGIRQPKGKGSPKVRILDIFNKNSVRKAIDLIRDKKKKVDILIVSLHWGIEYRLRPLKRQIFVAKRFIKNGADIILGHHPHVLEDIEYSKNYLIAYSLGNFISSQNLSVSWYNRESHKAYRGDSIILNFSIVKNDNKEFFIDDVHVKYLWMLFYRGKNGFLRAKVVNIKKSLKLFSSYPVILKLLRFRLLKMTNYLRIYRVGYPENFS